MKAISILLLMGLLVSFQPRRQTARLIFKEVTSDFEAGTSLCMYDDGSLYHIVQMGGVGQQFMWGHWTKQKDHYQVEYDSVNRFQKTMIVSKQESHPHQIVRFLDCYGQPIRRQQLYDAANKGRATYEPLFVTNESGQVKVKKGKVLQYGRYEWADRLPLQADTVTIRWQCNRESIEDFLWSHLQTPNAKGTARFIIINNKVEWLMDR